MELNIIKQIRALRSQLRHKPKDVVDKSVIKKKLKELRPVITRKDTKPSIKVDINGTQMTLKEIATTYNLHLKTVEARYRVGNRGRLLIRPSQKTYNHKPNDDLTNIV